VREDAYDLDAAIKECQESTVKNPGGGEIHTVWA
jgi:hypothetical protein